MISPSALVKYAKKFLGVPYVFGGTTPKGFDCSGLVQHVYGHFGINITRTTKTQINDGREVGRNELKLGDLVFPSKDHVTLYIGNGKVLHAPQPGEKVKISPIWAFWRARRILPSIPFGNFVLQARTTLHQTGDNFEFLVGDYNNNGRLDVYCIKKNGAGNGKTEVHILNGENNFQNYLFQCQTALGETDGNWQFCLGDYNGDGCLDLYCIFKRNTGSHSTEVHILSGKNNFQSFLLQTKTNLSETDETWKFSLGDYNGDGSLDLYCIKKRNTGSKKTEVHILGGKSNYQNFLIQTGTALGEVGDNWDFGVSGKNICCIAKNNTGSHKTEVHILNGNNNFQNFLIQSQTQLQETGNDFAFYVYEDFLIAFAKQSQNCTEVHCLSLHN